MLSKYYIKNQLVKAVLLSNPMLELNFKSNSTPQN